MFTCYELQGRKSFFEYEKNEEKFSFVEVEFTPKLCLFVAYGKDIDREDCRFFFCKDNKVLKLCCIVLICYVLR